jgi:hypothetical protein
MNAWQRISSWLCRLADETRAVAYMEFAFALPFLMVTLISGIEIVHLALTHQQLSRIATSTADLAARFRSSIDETDVNTLFLGARISASFDDFDARGRIVLSSITRNDDDDGHWIRWQRCDGDNTDYESKIGAEGDGEDDDTISTEDVGMLIDTGNNVMVAEVTYRYTPWFFPVTTPMLRGVAEVFTERDISYRSAFIARELTLNSITNTTGITGSAIATCA